jgi:hypothetical protein
MLWNNFIKIYLIDFFLSINRCIFFDKLKKKNLEINCLLFSLLFGTIIRKYSFVTSIKSYNINIPI